MISWPRVLVGVLPLVFAFVTGALAQDTHEALDREMAKPIIRGGIVFKNYCVVCHGERGDGAARAAKLYSTLNLAITPRTADYYGRIIRLGGEAVGASEFMPPWQEELSQEQINDVIAFLAVISSPVQRGDVVFKTNCVLCHGVRGDGKGRAAPLFHPAPADLTLSDKPDEYKRRIIRMGGAALHRSQGMPAWGERLTNREIEDVVAYLRTILVARETR
jgi:cytochrome c oxidase cbb3-type subunit III